MSAAALALALAVVAPGAGLWSMWVYGGDGQRFYRAMGWTAWWIVGR